MRFDQRLSELETMPFKELQAKYAELFGEATRSANRQWLVKRIRWRMQSRVVGDLSERAKRRAIELADDSDLRMKAPAKSDSDAEPTPPADDSRPTPGTVLTRPYKNRTLHVTVLDDGFEFEGERYPSLSAVAKKVTGQHLSGPAFFGLTKEAAK